MDRMRRSQRAGVSARVRLLWRDQEDQERYATVKTCDVSEHGMRVQSPEPVGVGSIVTFQCSELKLHGQATVKSCMRRKLIWEVGLEFQRGLKWTSEPTTLQS